MVSAILAFLVGILPGAGYHFYARGPRVDDSGSADDFELSLSEAAVLRDGALGWTRWAFAALVCRLAREGHCTLIRRRKRRWFRTVPVIVVDFHADTTTLSPFEITVLRQLGRHDTLDGFGLAGSTFRRWTLRDVRRDLVENGWMSDRSRTSTVLISGGLLLGAVGTMALTVGVHVFGGVSLGLGLGCTIAAFPRYPLTESGARRRASHRLGAEEQYERIRDALPHDAERAWAILIEALPALILERIATPRWLRSVAALLEAGSRAPDGLDWIQDEVDGAQSAAEACRTLGHVLRALGAHPLWGR